MSIFSLQYEFFRRIEKGRLLYQNGTTYQTFSLTSTRQLTTEFLKSLDSFLVENNYRFAYQIAWKFGLQIAEEVKIVLTYNIMM